MIVWFLVLQVYNNVNNHNTNYLAQLFCIGLGEVKSINQIYINAVPYFGKSSKTKAQDGKGKAQAETSLTWLLA